MKYFILTLVLFQLPFVAFASKPKLKEAVPKAEIIIFEVSEAQNKKVPALMVSYNLDNSFSYFKCMGLWSEQAKKLLFQCPEYIGQQSKYSVEQINQLAKTYITGDSLAVFNRLKSEGIHFVAVKKASEKMFDELVQNGANNTSDLINSSMELLAMDPIEIQQTEEELKTSKSNHPFTKAAFLAIEEWAKGNIKEGEPVIQLVKSIQALSSTRIELGLAQFEAEKAAESLNLKLLSLK